MMKPVKIAVVAPSASFPENTLAEALARASAIGFSIVSTSFVRSGRPAFLNGSKDERLSELIGAENLGADAIWCARGGCGAIELWQEYLAPYYENSHVPLIGYSDSCLFHFMRFLRASRIGIHGPVFFDLMHDGSGPSESIELLLNKRAQDIVYPALKPLNHFVHARLSGPLIPMNLMSLSSIVGCFDAQFFLGKILALEEINEPHYKVFRALHHLKNAGILTGLKAILVGYFNEDRQQIIDETLLPLAKELGIPLFDWPIFGHDKPNWPLLFGARVSICKVDAHYFTLTYDEQHDHTAITHGP